MTKVRISDDALADLNEGYWFYEAQSPGLKDYFSASLQGDVESLKVSAGAHPVVYGDYHRHLSRIFPDGIYLYDADSAVVWAALDLRRDPKRIVDRLTK
jgi:plasmid stabilization system protein ParE